jgi:radical SAM superfamily enzyme YgiQ (UPF0313 family)
MRKGFHERPIPAIMEEIRFLHKNYFISHFDFEDELLMASEKRTEEICQAILKLPFKIKWDCNGRLNYATPPILSLMKKAGAEYVNYGIESLEQSLLNAMGKGLTIRQIYQGVEATLKTGLSPGLNLLWGFPNDTEANLKEEVKFIKEFNPGDENRTIRPPTPYPGCRLFNEAIEKGLVDGVEDFYENKFKNSDLLCINFTDIPVEDANRLLFEANKELYLDYLSKREKNTLKVAENLYLKKDYSFRGWRPV